MKRFVQISVNLTTFDTWRRLMFLENPLMAYAAPGSGYAIGKDARLVNIGGITADVEMAISNTNPPQDITRLIPATTVLASESSIIQGVFVIPQGFSVYARLTAYAGYPDPSVTVQVAVMEVT